MFVVAICLTACNAPKQVGPKAVAHWAYAPASLAVHPLCRFTDHGSLIVHVKLLDGDGYSCRGVGKLHLNVTTTENRSLNNTTIQLDNPEINRNHFDDVTRTYRIPVSGVPHTINKVGVYATFEGADESPMKSESYTVVRKQNKNPEGK